MTNVAVITVHLEDFDMKVLSLPEDHQAVEFCKRWEESGQGEAWIDGGNDLPELIKLSEELWSNKMKKNEIPLPCMVDHTLFIIVY